MDKNVAVRPKAPETETNKLDLARAVHTFAEIYELLEEYGPQWYSQDVHDRVESTLVFLRASLSLEPPNPENSEY